MSCLCYTEKKNYVTINFICQECYEKGITEIVKKAEEHKIKQVDVVNTKILKAGPCAECTLTEGNHTDPANGNFVIVIPEKHGRREPLRIRVCRRHRDRYMELSYDNPGITYYSLERLPNGVAEGAINVPES